MSVRYLGENFDIHTGGVDHIGGSPHQRDRPERVRFRRPPLGGRTGSTTSSYDLSGEKMSKSKGNIALLSDLADKGVEPLAYRYFFLQGHYRQQVTLTDDALQGAQTGYRRLLGQAARLNAAAAGEDGDSDRQQPFRERFEAALYDDLNAPKAMAVVWEVVRGGDLSDADRRALLHDFDSILALGLAEAQEEAAPAGESDPRIDGLIAERKAARDAKDWAEADRIRDELAAGGHRDRRFAGRDDLEAKVMSPARKAATKAKAEPKLRARDERAFELVSEFEPRGDQPQAIAQLVEGVRRGDPHQTLLGVTGSGKTFSIACAVAELDRPTIVMSPNKTLAAQLYAEFKELFPNNAVEYFVSYYDYYQPEAYVPSSDTYIEKDSTINEQIDRMRHAATYSLLSRRDVIIICSVSCIYGIGAAEAYLGMVAQVAVGEELDRDQLLRRSSTCSTRATITISIAAPSASAATSSRSFRSTRPSAPSASRFFGDEIDSIAEIDPLRGKVLSRPKRALIFPASHYVATEARLKKAIDGIRDELDERLHWFKGENKLLEAQRLEQRTMYDVEMLQQMGFCHGVENYSRWLDGRSAGQTPYTLYDYLPEDTVVVLDESHISVPQIGGMSRGDRARKETLVDFGWRLPSALDNRPLGWRSGRRASTSASTSRRRRPTTSSNARAGSWSSRSSDRRA